MSTIIKRNVILTPAEYDGISQTKGIVTFEILESSASGFLRCYNLENKDNLVFGVKINDKMFKFKLQTGLDILTFSLDTREPLQNCKISCALVRTLNGKTQTILIGSTETTKLYSNEILTFLNTSSDEIENSINDKIKEQTISDSTIFKMHEFFEDDSKKKENFQVVENVNTKKQANNSIDNNNETLTFNTNSDLTENEILEHYENGEELENYIDDLSCPNPNLNKCKNCMYKNYFYCNNKENAALTEISALNKTKQQNLTSNNVNTQTAFYDSLAHQIDSLILNNIHEEVLEEILPNSTFVRIERENGKYYVLGIINGENGMPQYLCYGHPAKSKEDKPFNFDNHFSFFPIDVDAPNGAGYYLSYQSAENGENVKITLI